MPRGSRLAASLTWVQDHLKDELTLEAIAAHGGMSTRSLTRRFREHTGTTPLQWLLRVRVRRAQYLLEQADGRPGQPHQRSPFRLRLPGWPEGDGPAGQVLCREPTGAELAVTRLRLADDQPEPIVSEAVLEVAPLLVVTVTVAVAVEPGTTCHAPELEGDGMVNVI